MGELCSGAGQDRDTQHMPPWQHLAPLSALPITPWWHSHSRHSRSWLHSELRVMTELRRKLLQDTVCVWPGLETMCGSGEAISAADVVCSNGDEQYSAIRGHTQPICRDHMAPCVMCPVSRELPHNCSASDNYTESCHTNNGQWNRKGILNILLFSFCIIVCVIAEWNEILCWGELAGSRCDTHIVILVFAGNSSAGPGLRWLLSENWEPREREREELSNLDPSGLRQGEN